uniref:Uncharacterized protein n=1 Tax=Arundo donax TaxID=35708 RepID=A0A0A9F0R4_ARUDO
MAKDTGIPNGGRLLADLRMMLSQISWFVPLLIFVFSVNVLHA